jgi:ADP-ribose pyrophosphatase
MERPYKVSSSEEMRIGRFSVVQDTILIDGSEHIFSYIKEKDCSCILPLFENKIVGIKQYRHAINKWRLELPTGAIGDGETPDKAARRELLEETGFVADELIYLGECYIKPGTNTGKAYLYIAKCTEIHKLKLDKTELIDVQMYTISEFEKLIEMDLFGHVLGLVCWYKAKKYIM